MRTILLIANFIFLMGQVFLLRTEMGKSYSPDPILVALSLTVLVLTCFNIGYISATRTDQSISSRISRFRKAWAESRDQQS